MLNDKELYEALRQLLAEVGSSAAGPGISTTPVKTESEADGVDKDNCQLSPSSDGDAKPPPLPEDIDASLAAASIGSRELPLQEFPSEAPPIGAPGEPKTVLTRWADERSMLEPELLDNVVKRIRDRGTVLNYFVSGNGWLWVNMCTEALAARACQRLGSLVVDGGRADMPRRLAA